MSEEVMHVSELGRAGTFIMEEEYRKLKASFAESEKARELNGDLYAGCEDKLHDAWGKLESLRAAAVEVVGLWKAGGIQAAGNDEFQAMQRLESRTH